MPLYDFQCDHCQKVFEVRATFKEKDAGLDPICPRCSRKQAHQLLSSPMIMLHDHGGASKRGHNCSSGCGGNCSNCN